MLIGKVKKSNWRAHLLRRPPPAYMNMKKDLNDELNRSRAAWAASWPPKEATDYSSTRPFSGYLITQLRVG